MGRVSYDYFKQRRDYPNKPSSRSSFKISQYDFSKYAILNGKYGNYAMSYNAKGFYSSICKMAPDWFGLDQYGSPFWFESKGTIEKKVEKKQLLMQKIN